MAEGPASGQSRSYTTSATRELPTIRERRPSGLRRFWGSASSGGSQRAPSVASVASSAAESAPEQLWPRSRKVASPSSSASSDLDSAQALSHRRPKVSAYAEFSLMTCLQKDPVPQQQCMQHASMWRSAQVWKVAGAILFRSWLPKCVQCAHNL